MRISKTLLDKILDQARQAYPGEACGLLAGRPGGAVFSDIIPSPNRAEKDDEFQIDPALHLKAQRELRKKGLVIMGVYHSHPGGDSRPSETDRKGPSQPRFYWLITTFCPEKHPKTELFREKISQDPLNLRNFEKVHLQIVKNNV